MILVIDNYDSFVHNLARYVVRAYGKKCAVIRNDRITLEEAQSLNPHAIVISPGPCAPQQAGLSNEIIRHFGQHTPILGVCLGHQCIGAVYGGMIQRAEKPLHGQAGTIRHSAEGLFKGLPADFEAGRYHSLIVKLPAESPLRVTATSEEGEIMGLQHQSHPVYGVQFHPESILTPLGPQIIENFLGLAESFHQNQVCPRRAA